jgi:hypothetical protein
MGRKIKLVNKKRFALACMTLVSFAAFLIVLIDFLATPKSTWSWIETRENSDISNQKILIEAAPQTGSILYEGDVIAFAAIHSYTVKETGEQKSVQSDKKVSITASDPVVGTVDADNNRFIITQKVSESKQFSLSVAYEDKTETFDYKLFPTK